MTNKTFAAEMRDVLDIASALLRESDTEETRMYVQHKLKDIQTYLQEKQLQSEKALEERIEKEQKSINELEERIARISDGTVTENEALDYLRMFVHLKDNEWDEAFNALLEDDKNSVERILKLLIDILKITFDECRKSQIDQTTEIAIEARYAEASLSGKKDLNGLTPDQEAELRGHVRYLQDKTTQYCVQSISENLLGTIKSDKRVDAYYHKYSKSERVVTAFDEYIKKCIQFSWVAHFEHPPVHLITEPKRECPKIIDQFVDYKIVPAGKFVDWPALVKGVSLKGVECEVKVPWHLYEIKRQRPRPRPRKVPTPPPEREPEPRAEFRNTETDDDAARAESRETNVHDARFSIHIPGDESPFNNQPIKKQGYGPDAEYRQTPLQTQSQQSYIHSGGSQPKPQMKKGNRPTTRSPSVADLPGQPPPQHGSKSTNTKNEGEPRIYGSMDF